MPLSLLEDDAIARAEEDLREARRELAVAAIRHDHPLAVAGCVERALRKLDRAEETLHALRRESAGALAIRPITPPRRPTLAVRPPFPGAEEDAPLEFAVLLPGDQCGDPECPQCGDEPPGHWSGTAPIAAPAPEHEVN